MWDVKSKILKHHIEVESFMHQPCDVLQFISTIINKVRIVNQRGFGSTRNRIRLHDTVIHTLDLPKIGCMIHVIILIHNTLFITAVLHFLHNTLSATVWSYSGYKSQRALAYLGVRNPTYMTECPNTYGMLHSPPSRQVLKISLFITKAGIRMADRSSRKMGLGISKK